MIEARILGCGSSGGVPRLGGEDGAGNWGTCDPGNPRNRRSRCSLLLRRKTGEGETLVLVDTPPDMRQQLLDARVTRLDGVLITHAHADQLHGMDDLRVLTLISRRRIDVWIDRFTMDQVMQKFDYCFVQPPGSDYPPILNAHQIPEPFHEFSIGGPGGTIPIRAFGLKHGAVRALGFRFGALAYTPDVDSLDEAAYAALEGLDVWIVDALRRTPHPSHAHLARTLEWIVRVKPKRAILTNMHVDMDYGTLLRELPPGTEPAYDGMTIPVIIPGG
jgi:phosphoribosyl 1,2-cyclic phosphate phosphodiesterase